MNMKTLLKPIYRASIKSIRQDRRSVDRVHSVYTKLLKNPDVKPLTSALEKQARSYAKEVFGSLAFYPWIRNYVAYRGEFVEGWIPSNFYMQILPKLNGDYRQIGQARTLTRQIFNSDVFPDLAYYVNGSWFSVGGVRLRPSEVRDAIFSGSGRAFLKLEASSQGKGIIPVEPHEFNNLNYSRFGNFVMQKAIKQHEWFDQIFSDAVATIRITTVVPRGQDPEMRAAYLRLGRGKSQFVVSSDSVRVPIIDHEGTLADFASDTNWMRHTRHPDSGFSFTGQQIPYFRKAVAACEALHRKVPQFSVIGWDAIVTPQGKVEIMEWNTNEPVIAFSEASTGPCFTGLGWEKLEAA
jgi:hypothetical protein